MKPIHSDPLRHFAQAAALHDSGRLLEAERLYQMLLQADDRHFDALCRFAVLRLQQVRFADAEVLLRRAIKLDKRSAEAHQLLGSALTGLGRWMRPRAAMRRRSRFVRNLRRPTTTSVTPCR